jgi:hypothetical protein
MVGLVALITLIVLVVRARARGDPWLYALFAGVRRSLRGVLAGYAAIIVLAFGFGVLDAALRPVADTALGLLPEGRPPASRAGSVVASLPTSTPDMVTASQPTPTPRSVKLAFQGASSEMVTAPTPMAQVRQEFAILPTSTPRPTLAAPAPTSTPTPENDREGCDAAYPDERTCIPPGPPWDQGCAITPERLFTVLPPDPQGLDHDGDGIGCEPVS